MYVRRNLHPHKLRVFEKIPIGRSVELGSMEENRVAFKYTISRFITLVTRIGNREILIQHRIHCP